MVILVVLSIIIRRYFYVQVQIQESAAGCQVCWVDPPPACGSGKMNLEVNGNQSTEKSCVLVEKGSDGETYDMTIIVECNDESMYKMEMEKIPCRLRPITVPRIHK